VGNTKIGEIDKVDQVDGCNKQVVFHPVFLYPAPDHNTYIWNQGGSQEKQKMNIEQRLIRLLRFRDFLSSEQEKVSKSKE
jgi:hypothetical protein